MKTGGALRNLVEPEAFARLFCAYPPVGFDCRESELGVPVFSAGYDLFTTLDDRLLPRIQALPFFSSWSELARWKTCFIGSCITEYAPLPYDCAPETFVAHVLAEHAQTQKITVIKDVPNASPFLSPEDNVYSDALVSAARAADFMEIAGQALAYVPLGDTDEDAYWARFSLSRRKDMRRKLKSIAHLDIEHVPLGDRRFEDPDLLSRLYAMYQAVFAQSDIHFDQLTPAFFAELLQSQTVEGLVVLYSHRSTLVGYNICLIRNGSFVDKYVGFSYPASREHNLYFVSWFENMRLARSLGLRYYIAGWTDPEVKASLGASFTFTRHLVWIKNPLLRAVLRPIRHLFEADANAFDAKQKT